LGGLDVRAEARTYLRSKCNGKDNGKSEKQIPFGNDKQEASSAVMGL